jgi:ketosteroid isomerase-like protein
MRTLRFAVIVSSLTAAVSSPAPAKQPDATDVIRRQSQAFSDASASGDAKTLERLLDDRVTFMLEDGRLVTKKDIVDGAAPPSNPNVRNHLQQQDFAVQVYGSTAVTSFTDVSSLDYYGQQATFRFRSTEVWRASGGAWKMISSQTVYEPKDPPAITVPAQALEDYVGRYELSPDYVLVISRDKDGLQGSVGAQSFPLYLEARDVLFVQGQPLQRRIIQRDATGRVTGLVSRRYGSDFVFRKVG